MTSHRQRVAACGVRLCGMGWALLVLAPLGAAVAQPRPRTSTPPPIFSTNQPRQIDGVVSALIPPLSDGGNLAGVFYYLVDPSGELTIDEIRSPEMDHRFQLSEDAYLNLGFSSSALWLRIDTRQRTNREPNWMLTFDYPLLDRIDIYDGASARRSPVIQLGDLRPFSERIVPHRSFAVPLDTRGPPWRRLYIRIESQSSLQVHPRILPGVSVFLTAHREEFAFGLAYGFMTLMAIYNAFLFLQLRDKSYLLYVGSTGAGLLFLMSLNGHAFRYLWPEWPVLANQANPVLASLWVLTTAGFAKLFLEPGRRAPRVAGVINLLIVIGGVSTLVALVASYRPSMVVASASALVNALSMLICGVIFWIRGVRAARFFTLAWLGLAFGTINLAISRFGFMPDNPLTRNAVVAGAMLEMVFLSLALSDKYRLMQLELEGYSKGLEAMVDERTSQLAEANASLQQLATTDSLTSLFNRRHFQEQLDKELRRHKRFDMPLSLALIDIDHFKDFNDRYGHPAGDECLREVAEAISSVAQRPGDLVARYGGEEFAVLLPHTDRAGARALGEEIRKVVRDRRIAEAWEGQEPVEVSVGLSTLQGGDAGSAEALVKAADGALYEAKRGGRNRVVEASQLG